MANFDIAYRLTIRHEGGYVNDPNDTGGETYWGLSRKHNPKWEGWAIIDNFKVCIGQLKTGYKINSTLLDNLVKKQYKRKYWGRLGQIESQVVANAVFDMIVNAGRKRASILLQKTLNEHLNQFIEELKVDGIIGPKTIKAVNLIKPQWLCNKYTYNRVQFYFELCEKRGVNYNFLRGWVNRAMRYIIRNEYV